MASNHNFALGERVRHTREDPPCPKGPGTVRYVSSIVGAIAIEMDQAFYSGHDCDGHCANGKGWWIDAKYLEPLPGEAPAFDMGAQWAVERWGGPRPDYSEYRRKPK